MAEECPICLIPLDENKNLFIETSCCDSKFCFFCLDDWLATCGRSKFTCPKCRCPLDTSFLPKDRKSLSLSSSYETSPNESPTAIESQQRIEYQPTINSNTYPGAIVNARTNNGSRIIHVRSSIQSRENISRNNDALWKKIRNFISVIFILGFMVLFYGII